MLEYLNHLMVLLQMQWVMLATSLWMIHTKNTYFLRHMRNKVSSNSFYDVFVTYTHIWQQLSVLYVHCWQARRQDFAAGGAKNHPWEATFFKYNIGCMQQPRARHEIEGTDLNGETAPPRWRRPWLLNSLLPSLQLLHKSMSG